jgi:predicted permease
MQDVRYAIRALLRTPAVTGTALVMLTLGIGATTGIFSVASGVLLRPLPFAEPERLVHVGTMGLTDFQGVRAQSRSVTSTAAYSSLNKNLQNVVEPERVAVVSAERTFFQTLGVQAASGRTFGPDDPLNVAVVSTGFARQRLGGTPLNGDVSVTLDGQPFAVIGVMPDGFQFPYRATATDIWVPADLPVTANRFQRIDAAIARLASGVTFAAAEAELRAIARQLDAQRGSSEQDAVFPMMPLMDSVVARSRNALLALLGAVGMLLLVACANVANILLARSEARRYEVGVRTALGASRGRLVRQFLVESMILAFAGGAAALVLAPSVTQLVLTFAGDAIPRAIEIAVDWRVFGFIAAVCVTTGLVFGLVPALSVTQPGVSGVVNALSYGRASRGRGATFVSKALVVGEIALACVLLTGAGLLLRAFVSLERTPTGAATENVLTMRMETRGLQTAPAGGTSGPRGATTQGRYFAAIEERVSRVPGVRAAGFVTQLPIQTEGNSGRFQIVGRPSDSRSGGPSARLRDATPGYFRAMGIPLRRGRLFPEIADTTDASMVLVNEALVHQYFGAEDPIGRVLDRGTIIGVVGDVRQNPRVAASPEIYAPLARTSYSTATLVINGSVPVEPLMGSLRAAIREVSPNQPVFNVRTMDSVLSVSHADLNLYLWLTGSFASLALVLSMVGIYGVVSYLVASRQREFGIRLALGAKGTTLLRMVLRQGAVLVIVGALIGVAGALALTRFLRAVLYGVTATDPLTFAAVMLLVVAVALVACVSPARRAMELDPATVLRRD